MSETPSFITPLRKAISKKAKSTSGISLNSSKKLELDIFFMLKLNPKTI